MRATVGSLLLLLGCGASPPEPVGGPLELASVVAAARPFRAASVEAALGVPLVRTGANPSFALYEGGPAGPFSGVELREPTTAGRDGMVLLTVGQGCVRPEDVGDRFGALGEPVIRSPHEPPGSPRYDAYPQGWGEVRLGYDPATGCLVSIVLDAIGP